MKRELMRRRGEGDPAPEGDGIRIFRNAVEYVRKKL